MKPHRSIWRPLVRPSALHCLGKTFISPENRKAVDSTFKAIQGHKPVHLFIQGDSGTGKTFILESAANFLTPLASTRKFEYGNVYSLFSKVGTKGSSIFGPRLDRRLRGLEILLLDEMDNLLRLKPGPRVTRLHALLAKLLAKVDTVILCSEEPMASIVKAVPALAGSLKGFKNLEIQPLSFKSRVRFIREGLYATGISLPQDTAEAIVTRTKGTLHQLSKVTGTLAVWCAIHKRPPTSVEVSRHYDYMLGSGNKC